MTKGHRALPAKWKPGLGRMDHYEALIEDSGTIAITQRLRAITPPSLSAAAHPSVSPRREHTPLEIQI